MKLRVAILYGGRSAEHEVSVVSARSLIAAMDSARYEAVPVAITKGGRWLLPSRAPGELEPAPGSLPGVEDEGTEVVLVRRAGRAAFVPVDANGGRGEPIDVVFPVLHGPGGEDGSVQGLLEVAGVPYVGGGVAASALGMDKELQKIVFAARGIPVVRFATVRADDWGRDAAGRAPAIARDLGLPCFTKPSSLGSSVGIRKCATTEEMVAGIEEALRHGRKALVEEAIDGRELECAVLGNDDPRASVVGEIVPANEFYDYEAKYLAEGSRLVIPAEVPEAIAERVRQGAVEAFRAIDCAGMARVDFFYDEAAGRVLLNEINTIPGFTPISMYPKLWEASGILYPELIGRLIDLALQARR